MLIWRSFFTFLITLLFSNLTLATTNASLNELAKHRYWLDLLHYHQTALNFTDESQIDDPSFFLAQNGQVNPYNELVATIAAFTKPAEKGAVLPAQCKYPARFHWLQKKLPNEKFITENCPEFNDWFNKINGEKVYLIFPAAYLNSPSSMYGHTLFRIKSKGNNNALLDFAVNYAANPDPNDNQLVFSYKGLTGNYPGVISVMPYYEKVQEYSFLENRDIWEYELNLSPNEVAQLTRHIWEMRNTFMDYYFFTENCSYQLLSMIDASSENISLLKAFRFRAIPTDTIRALDKSGLINNAIYRPAMSKKMISMEQQLSTKEISLAKKLVEASIFDQKALSALSIYKQSQVLELSYQYSRYLSAKKKSTLAHLGKRSITLLSLRSKLPTQQTFKAVSPPKLRDDQGHKTQRVSAAVGRIGEQNYQEIQYRPSYHDLLDSTQGYIKNSQLVMGDTIIRKYENDKVRFHQFDLINIRSLSPQSQLLTPKAWQVTVGLARPLFAEQYLSPTLSGGYGISYNGLGGNWSVLLQGQSYFHSHLNKGRHLAAGPQINYLLQAEKSNLLLSYQKLFGVGEQTVDHQKVALDYSYLLTSQWQARLSLNHHKIDQSNKKQIAFSLLYYY